MRPKENTKPPIADDAGVPRSSDSAATDVGRIEDAPDISTAPVNPVAELESKVKSLEDSLLRSRADFQNLQRRAAADKADAIRYGNAELLRSLLGVLDDFERTVEASENPQQHQAVVDGVRLIHGNLFKALREAGLETIEATGQRFDPTIHEALLMQEAVDRPPGTVIEQVAKGYKLGQRVLRPARVIVVKSAETGEATSSAPNATESVDSRG